MTTERINMTPAIRPLVLVVEDEALLLFSIADELRESGFEVIEATNADMAIQALTENPAIEVVFTDIDMPGSMDGIRLSSIVRHRWPPIQIIVTSGKARPLADALPAGSKFLTKPYSPVTVALEIRHLLAV
jgi:CheY-like chemotaxis protein